MWSKYLIFGIVAISTAVFYLSVAPSRLTNANIGSDGGDLLTAVMVRGIPHPTGYPTYVLLGNLFQIIPIGTPVYRAVLESLVPTAIGAGLLTSWMIYILGTNSIVSWIAAVLAGLSYGAAPLVFSQAVIVEVHGLQSLIVILVLWWLTLNLAPGTKQKWLYVLSFLVGIGIGNHLTILLFLPVALVVFIHLLVISRAWKLVLYQITLVIAGMLVYLYLPISARTFPAVNWGNPQTWSGFVWEISATPYHSFLVGIKPAALLEQLRSSSSLLFSQFGAIGLIAGAIGIVQFSSPIKWLRLILIWIFIAFLIFAIAYKSNDSEGYLIPAIMAFSIWIGCSVPIIWNLKLGRFPLGISLIAVLSISILVRIPGTRNLVDPRKQDQAARYAEQVLKDAPQDAIVYTTSDQDSFPLWYYHFALKERQDLRIIVLPLTQFTWYQQTLVHVYPGLEFPQVYTQDQPNADWGKGIALLNPNLPVCHTRITSDLETGVEFKCSQP